MITLRDTLNENEKPIYDLFVKTEGIPPKSMWELMQYSYIMQQQAKESRKFWGGILGF